MSNNWRETPSWFWPWAACVGVCAGLLLGMSGMIVFARHYRMNDFDRALFYVAAAIVAVLLPAGVMFKRRWDRAHPLTAEGRCRNCGYDLRASAERCPECGEAILRRDPASGDRASAHQTSVLR
ncbi:MAG: hypothetical protein ACTHLN_12080 [Tepidisphaeraceae bacterium]